eukprot:5563269-Pyramimonas_sp.AAC.1
MRAALTWRDARVVAGRNGRAQLRGTIQLREKKYVHGEGTNQLRGKNIPDVMLAERELLVAGPQQLRDER